MRHSQQDAKERRSGVFFLAARLDGIVERVEEGRGTTGEQTRKKRVDDGCWLKRERRSVSRCSDSWTMEAIGGRERRESKREYSGAMRKRMRVGREG